MLEMLAQYADQQGLTVEPGFKPKTVKWLIRLDPKGQFAGVDILGDADSKEHTGLVIDPCPEYPANEMNSGGKAHPLVESLNAVCLMPGKQDEDPTEKDRAKWEHFVGLLEELGDEIPDALLAAKALRDPSTSAKIVSRLFDLKAKAIDKGTICVGQNWLVRDEVAYNWWRAKWGVTPSENGVSVLDFVTGELVNPLASHPKIAGLNAVGGSPIGSSLISFDKDAFASYGLQQSENASVSMENAYRYRAGLNAVIRKGTILGPMIVGHWFSRDIPIADDPLSWIDNGGESSADALDAKLRANQLMEAIKKGERPELLDAYYWIIHVSGAKGRVMVRDWSEGQFKQLVENINSWFDDLEMTAIDGSSSIRAPKFKTIADSTFRKRDNPGPPMMAALYKAATHRTVIPMNAVQGAMACTKIDLMKNTFRPERMALLRAYIVRSTQNGENMKPHLNEEHPNVAYHAGRLLSVYANVQKAALGDVNANIVQRFFPAAMATPSLVFQRLAKLGNFHLNKLEGGLRHFFEAKLGGIYSSLGDGLPKKFTPEEQTLFALGYYQQMAFDALDSKQRGAANQTARANLSSGETK